jgi:hypothetical protein
MTLANIAMIAVFYWLLFMLGKAIEKLYWEYVTHYKTLSEL